MAEFNLGRIKKMTELSIIYKHQLSIKKINQPMRSRENAHHSEVCGRPFSSDKHLDCPRLIKAGSQYIYMYFGSKIKVKSYQDLFSLKYIQNTSFL